MDPHSMRLMAEQGEFQKIRNIAMSLKNSVATPG